MTVLTTILLTIFDFILYPTWHLVVFFTIIIGLVVIKVINSLGL